MRKQRLSKRADFDIAEIADYTIKQFRPGVTETGWKKYFADSRNIRIAAEALGILLRD